MPIEIRELHIKVNVESDSANASASGTSTSSSAPGGTPNPQAMEDLVAAIVDQVLEVLRMKQER